MKKAFTPKKNKHENWVTSNMSLLTSPWFVIALVVICFAILTPKIFMPIFMQLFGLNQQTEPQKTANYADPRVRHHANPGDPRSGPQFGRPGPGHSPPPATPAKGGGLLTFLLPVYAIGIGIYMVYTLFKVFKKDDDKKDENDSDFDEIEKRNFKFKEKSRIEAAKYIPQQRSEESEDEINEYARYNSVDPEYLQYLKKARKQKRKKEKNNKDINKNAMLVKTSGRLDTDEISLTPNTGMTSITNTNVLMNDTLERMKHSLNKINGQLVQVEKKGHPMEDPELDSLKLQLTQTELQMSKIMTIVNNVSATLEKQNRSNDDEDEYDDEDECIFHEKQGLSKNSMEINKNALRNRKKKAQKMTQQQQFQMQNYSHEDEESGSSNSVSSSFEYSQNNNSRNMYQNTSHDEDDSDDVDDDSDDNEEIIHINKKKPNVQVLNVKNQKLQNQPKITQNNKNENSPNEQSNPANPGKNKQRNLKKKLKKKAKKNEA